MTVLKVKQVTNALRRCLSAIEGGNATTPIPRRRQMPAHGEGTVAAFEGGNT